MDAEGDSPSDRGAKLISIIAQLEGTLAELDETGLSRIALPVNEAIELAKAAQFLIQSATREG